MSVSSELIFVPEPRAEPLGLKDAPFPVVIPWYPQQAQHIVGVQKNGHWIDEGTAAVVKAGSSTQPHKKNALRENIPNKPNPACRRPPCCDPLRAGTVVWNYILFI